MDVIVPEISGIPEISKWSLKFPEIPYFPYFPYFPDILLLLLVLSICLPLFHKDFCTFISYLRKNTDFLRIQAETQLYHELVIGPRNTIFSL